MRRTTVSTGKARAGQFVAWRGSWPRCRRGTAASPSRGFFPPGRWPPTATCPRWALPWPRASMIETPIPQVRSSNRKAVGNRFQGVFRGGICPQVRRRHATVHRTDIDDPPAGLCGAGESWPALRPLDRRRSPQAAAGTRPAAGFPRGRPRRSRRYSPSRPNPPAPTDSPTVSAAVRSGRASVTSNSIGTIWGDIPLRRSPSAACRTPAKTRKPSRASSCGGGGADARRTTGDNHGRPP